MTRAALAIGGTSALSACLEAEQGIDEQGDSEQAAREEGSDGPNYPTGVDDLSLLPDRQHAWDDYLVHGAHGTVTQSQNQLLLGLSYEGSTPPTDSEREQVESALTTLERAFRWGSGLDTSGSVNNGLLFMIGYSPGYLDRVGADGDLPGLQRPEEILDVVGEDPALAADFDALLVLDSDYASILLAAEEALFGEKEELNGIPVEDRLTDVFEVSERRTGVLGKGRAAEEIDHEDIPEDAPMSMGFRAGFENSQPPEETATISEGPFADGTTLAVALLKTDLDEWYDQPHDDQLKEMYCPAHDYDDVGDVGDALGDHSGITEENVERMEELADEHDMVGHAQKTADARDDDFEPRIHRRSEGFAADAVHGSTFNFTSIQRDTQAFVDVRVAMNIDEYDLDVPEEKHGIVSYLETVSRSTFIVPSRADRALPTDP